MTVEKKMRLTVWTISTALLVTALLCLGVSPALASKQAVDFFGGQGSLGGQFHRATGVAVNSTGAGPANQGDVYVVEQFRARVQRFGHDDSGTPADPTDDSYFFISAWGGDVDSIPSGGANYEICTVASRCQGGIESGGNGSAAGDGTLREPQGIAIDQDTGEVYVSDSNNFRVNVYAGDGAFLRSFGWDVAESGPGDNGTAYEVCVAADGDVCKAGLSGGGAGQLGGSVGVTGKAAGVAISPADGNPTTGQVFVVDGSDNSRVNTYGVDGSGPSSFGSGHFGFHLGIGGSEPIAVDSRGVVYVADIQNSREIDRYDSQNANGGGIGFLTSIPAPPLLVPNGRNNGLAVDPDSDGVGPDVDVLYALRESDAGPTVVQQFGPANSPGLTAPPTAADDEHGSGVGFKLVEGLALDYSSGRLFVAPGSNAPSTGDNGPGVYVLDNTGAAPPSATLDSLSDPTATAVTVHATIDPNGPPDLNYHLEYSTNGVAWKSASSKVLGHQEDPQAINEVLSPPPLGLTPNTFYHIRIVIQRRFADPIASSELTFTTLAEKPIVETTGSSLRASTTAQLNGRVNPRNSNTTYHFEYGSVGSCEANPCESTEPHAAGSGDEIKLVSQRVEALEPDTIYHYRVVAESTAPGSPSVGADMTVTTRVSDVPLSHGPFSGPRGSDRAYEQVNLPDTGGNPVPGALAVSDDGNRAFYKVSGGTPVSNAGSFFGQLYAERKETAPHQGGWLTTDPTPPRDEVISNSWGSILGRSDLSDQILLNTGGDTNLSALWRMRPGQSPTKVFEIESVDFGFGIRVSKDASRVLIPREEPLDPTHPSAAINWYDISSGTPHLVSLMPDGSVPTCAVGTSALSSNGSLLFFKCGDGLYIRDLVAEQTKLIAPGDFSKSIAGAAFLTTSQSLEPGDAGGNDIYRYGIGDETLQCVTCVVPGLDAAVNQVAIADDGSRAYFTSSTPLRPGAGTPGIYRLVVASGDLTYVGPASDADINGGAEQGKALTPDGSALIFASADLGLNAIGGQQNGGLLQYYRYDDRDRSLICLSCPQDGGAPFAAVQRSLAGTEAGVTGANKTAISADGRTFAFATTTPLLGADQNTARSGQKPPVGTDIYEWRDGRLLMVTDGLTDWGGTPPDVSGIVPSGNDIFFTAATQYTPDALDGYRRLYDARIGGGFEFPVPPKPCPLEVCQGTPKGAPEEQAPGTGSYAGPGNAQQRANQRKKRHKKKSQHKKKSHKKQSRHAKHDRRDAR